MKKTVEKVGIKEKKVEAQKNESNPADVKKKIDTGLTDVVLGRIGDLNKKEEAYGEELKKASADVETKRKLFEESARYLKEPIKLPELKLEKAPETPKEPIIDFRNKWVALGHLVISIGSIVAAMKGGDPLVGLAAYNKATEALRNRRLDEFNRELERLKLEFQRINANNQIKIAEYNAEIEKAKFGDKRAQELLTHNYNELQLAVAQQSNINQAILKIQELKDKSVDTLISIKNLEEKIRHDMALEQLRAKQLDIMRAELSLNMEKLKKEVEKQKDDTKKSELTAAINAYRINAENFLKQFGSPESWASFNNIWNEEVFNKFGIKIPVSYYLAEGLRSLKDKDREGKIEEYIVGDYKFGDIKKAARNVRALPPSEEDVRELSKYLMIIDKKYGRK